MQAHPRRGLLRKIAARRARVMPEGPDPWLGLAAHEPGPTPRRVHPFGLLSPRILTRRELEVLQFVARGETDQGIADRLYLSRRTVNSHVSHILAKLDVPTRRAAVITAARIGLL